MPANANTARTRACRYRLRLRTTSSLAPSSRTRLPPTTTSTALHRLGLVHLPTGKAHRKGDGTHPKARMRRYGSVAPPDRTFARCAIARALHLPRASSQRRSGVLVNGRGAACRNRPYPNGYNADCRAGASRLGSGPTSIWGSRFSVPGSGNNESISTPGFRSPAPDLDGHFAPRPQGACGVLAKRCRSAARGRPAGLRGALPPGRCPVMPGDAR